MNARTLLAFVLFTLAALVVSCDQANPTPAPAHTPTATATVISLKTPTPRPSLTVTPTPLPTATPAPVLQQLTTGGCCVQPSWSLDSRQVLFLDKPSSNDPVGLYAVDVVTGALKLAQRVAPVATYSRDRSLIVYLDKNRTTVEKLSTGEKWIIPNNGKPVVFSPDGQKLSWADSDDNDYIPYDQRRSDLYIANIDGTQAARIARVYGGGFVGWLPGSNKILLSGRPSLDVHERTLSVFDLAAQSFTKLVTAERISGVIASNDGTWIAYYMTFDADKTRNGIWIQRIDGTSPRKLDLWGAYQWRDDGHLVVILTRPSRDKAFEVLEVDAATGKIRKLTDAAVTPLQILNGDWRVSPDGRHIVYVNSEDRNLWILTLPVVSSQ
jgi:Tol biopolymer transport system component